LALRLGPKDLAPREASTSAAMHSAAGTVVSSGARPPGWWAGAYQNECGWVSNPILAAGESPQYLATFGAL